MFAHHPSTSDQRTKDTLSCKKELTEQQLLNCAKNGNIEQSQTLINTVDIDIAP